jgi:large subunit ribosomal protein L9
MKMEVLLRDHVESLGECGDVVAVAPGFARNYLFPQRLAVEATADNKKQMVRRKVTLQAEAAVKHEAMEAWIAELSKVTLVTVERADAEGHLYGSVNAGAIAGLLEQAGHKVEEKNVRLDAPIKTVGTHTIQIHVHKDRFAQVALRVDGAK